ncbi:MAG: alpha/beta hydrolase [Chloracidobacterium sp.]|uniref:Alpha/beta hydrolase n=1 Tax=Chloracidobacterium validum TaxID=2821543 RepID=A0ABX8BBY6_9BACT|nr:alpha/beta hydrolase [Chloracidobacterium validum]QUW04186.1 alpha/beta hydrolase [Chloracidobacterium validum]
MTRPTIIAIHGNGGGAFRFARLRPFFTENAPVAFEALTLPGFGGTPRDPDCRTLADYADRIEQFLTRIDAPRILLGHGIGGSLALEYLQRFAPSVTGVILHAPVGARLDTRWFPRVMGFPATRELGKRMLASPVLRPLWRRMLFSQPVPDDVANRFFAEYGACEAFGQMFELITAEWFAALEPITIPAILLWGARERVLTLDQAADFRAKLPAATIEIVSDWDHFPMLEQPEAYARKLMALSARLLAPANVV